MDPSAWPTGPDRVRFLTSYPGDFGQDLIDAVANLPRVCEDVNLPIQSGDDDVLRERCVINDLRL